MIRTDNEPSPWRTLWLIPVSVFAVLSIVATGGGGGGDDDGSFVGDGDVGPVNLLPTYNFFLTNLQGDNLLTVQRPVGAIGVAFAVSIDIDGQDYHVWKALQATPPIVVIEYNPRKSGVDIQPRDDRYEWKRDKNYEQYGASRLALEKLAARKGYTLAGANTDNLFFTKE